MDIQPHQPSGGDQPEGGTPPDSGQHPGQPQQDPGHQDPGQSPWQPQQDPGQQYPGQPPVIAATGTGRPRVRPGRAWYLVALALVLAGVAWIVFGLVSVGHRVNSFPRVPLATGGTVTLDHSGGYVVYYEGPGASTGRIPSFNVRISPVAPPAAVASLRPYTASVSYSFGDRQGRAVLTLQVVHGGRFLIETSGASAPPGGSDLAFGSSIAGGIVSTVLPSIGLIFLGIIGAIVVAVIRSIRIRRARNQGL